MWTSSTILSTASPYIRSIPLDHGKKMEITIKTEMKRVIEGVEIDENVEVIKREWVIARWNALGRLLGA